MRLRAMVEAEDERCNYACGPRDRCCAMVPPYSQDWAEPQGDEVLMRAALRYLQPQRAALRPGDMLLFRMRDGAIAKHIGICATAGAEPTFIHAYSGHSVTESPLSQPWQRRIAARFAFPLGV